MHDATTTEQVMPCFDRKHFKKTLQQLQYIFSIMIVTGYFLKLLLLQTSKVDQVNVIWGITDLQHPFQNQAG
jgi:hypothetical protein